MAFDDLAQFLQSASDSGELERIDVPLSPVEEVAAVTLEICREFKERSPVILCDRPVNSEIPLVTNLLGNRQRFLRSLACNSIDDVVTRLRQSFNPFAGLGRDWKFSLTGNGATEKSRLFPRQIRRGACQQVVKLGKDLDLRELPVPVSWPEETHPTLTAGLVITTTTDGSPVMELVPVSVMDSTSLAIHWQPQHHGFAASQRAITSQQPVPVAIALGGDPLLTYVASLPLPERVDPWIFAGILRNEGVNLIRARSVELNVPADAEVVLEGYLDASQPFGPVTIGTGSGLLEQSTAATRMQVTSLTHRANPLLPCRVCAFDFQEDFVTSELTEKLLLTLLQMWRTDVVDLHLPACGGHGRIVFVSTSSQDAANIQQLFQAIGSLPFLDRSGMCVAVPAMIDLRKSDAVWQEVSLRFPAQDVSAAVLNQAGHRRLWIDAASTGTQSIQRCQSSQQILTRIAQRLGGDLPADEPVAHGGRTVSTSTTEI